jgi:phosphotriesterase-related protein
VRSINTVLGPIEADDLGWVLMHDHFFAYFTGYDIDGRNEICHDDDIRDAARDTAELRSYGIRTIVDPTPSEFRKVESVVQVAKGSGVNVVVCTGLYTEDNDGFPAYFRHRSIEEIADWMIHELTTSIGDTGIRAGAIKVATGVGRITANEEKAIRAAARAQREVGAPIITHTSKGTMGPEQVDILEDEGADLSRVVIGHCDANGDLNYHMDILRRGACVGIDQVGFTVHNSDEVRRGLVLSAYAAGYASQIVLSNDHQNCIYGRHSKPRDTNKSHLVATFIPDLLAHGASQRDIETSMVDLPRRLLAG